jgi:hypothetical protein
VIPPVVQLSNGTDRALGNMCCPNSATFTRHQKSTEQAPASHTDGLILSLLGASLNVLCRDIWLPAGLAEIFMTQQAPAGACTPCSQCVLAVQNLACTECVCLSRHVCLPFVPCCGCSSIHSSKWIEKPSKCLTTGVHNMDAA